MAKLKKTETIGSLVFNKRATKKEVQQILRAHNLGVELTGHLHNVVNKTWNFSGRLKTPQDHQMNALVGLASEAGETLDIGKKMWFHSEKPFSEFRAKLVLELGDILYYFMKVLDVFDISLEEVIAGNREKLESRHPELGKVTERFGKEMIR